MGTSPPRVLTAQPDTENPGGFTHLPALDGIRGTAILMVLFYHLTWSNDQTGSRFLDALVAVKECTYTGVTLFFALSGFLITGILLDTVSLRHFFRNFYARRALRIFPLYYGSLLLIVLLTRYLHMVWSGWLPFYLTYTSNISFLAFWAHRGPLYLWRFNINHFWSLQVEEQFYLVWPLIVFRVRRFESIMRLSLIACAAILTVRIVLVSLKAHPAFSDSYLVYSPTFACADNILFGCFLAAAVRSRWRETAMRFAPQVLTVCFLLLLVIGIANRGLAWNYSVPGVARFLVPTAGFSLLGIASAAIIAMTLKRDSRTERFFRGGFLRFFGKYSYGLYVFHYTIDGYLTPLSRAWLNAHLHSKLFSVLLGTLPTLAATILVAMLSYHLFEKQFLHLKRFFSYRQAVVATTVAS